MMLRLRDFVSASGLAVLSLVGLAGCDNPACVFSTQGCNTSGSGENGVGTAAASLPEDGNIILGALPTLEQALPSGDGAWPGTPVALRYSESMNPESLSGAFALVDRFSGTPFPIANPPVIMGDGRLVVLQPLAPLPDGRSYNVTLAPGALVTDVTGQEWSAVPGDLIASFSTDERVDPLPQVLMTVPADGDVDVSDLTEVSVVFDRAMNPTTFGAGSMFVRVGGVEPSPNPLASAATTNGTPIPSAWTWASTDVFGSRVSLGAGSSVTLSLSPNGFELEDTDAGALEATDVTFQLGDVAAPVGGTKPFGAQDAIGASDLADLVTPVLQIELAQLSQAGDELFVYIFGESLDGSEILAFERRVPLAGGVALVDLLSSDLQLLDGVGDGLLRDGTIRVAVRMARGVDQSSVRMLDGSPALDGIQDFIFDLTVPEIVSMGFSPEPTNILITDQRDLTVFGIAREAMAGVRVTSAFGDNVTVLDPPPLVQFGLGNVFVAASAPLGIVDPTMGPVAFSIEPFDNAFNTPAAPYNGFWSQVGVASTGALLPAAEIQVWVIDAETLLPVENARVITHQDNGGLTFLEADDTGPLGVLTLDAAGVGETVVTVDAAGFDLFTFHGAPRAVMQVLLHRTTQTPAQWEGQVQAASPGAPLQGLDVLVSDTRLNLGGPLARRTGACTLDNNANLYRCGFGPEVGRIGRVGFGTFVAADLSLAQVAFHPLIFLRAFGWETGQSTLVTSGFGVPSIIGVDALLTSGSVEELPIEVPAQVVSRAAAPSLGVLIEEPRVYVDGLSPGMDRPILVGMGITYSSGADTWDVRSAIPGVVDGVEDNVTDELGVLVEYGTLLPDHFLRIEAEDVDGNLSVVRRHLSALGATLFLPEVANLQSPASGANTGGSSYGLVLLDSLRDAQGMDGLYKAQLTDSTGRGWSLWHRDVPDGAGVINIQVPEIATAGGTPLVNGTIVCRTTMIAAPGLDTTQFMWSDLHREAELYVLSEEFSFTQN
ncbi:MAG: Ig-like domain-containing protein [Planctomycetota bacterium]|nr:Ig-like domain-containing protein [Planctomycetota bacterium]